MFALSGSCVSSLGTKPIRLAPHMEHTWHVGLVVKQATKPNNPFKQVNQP